MQTATPPPARLSMIRTALFLAFVLGGLGLFLWLAPRTPVVAAPAPLEVAPR